MLAFKLRTSLGGYINLKKISEGPNMSLNLASMQFCVVVKQPWRSPGIATEMRNVYSLSLSLLSNRISSKTTGRTQSTQVHRPP
ncbi:hypothetical protein HZ326_14224 [Fusarium oxysporum f. sp. albedinis]|nr:hypothetical protein HZ326_14224 [Fusarium oxysporum f. sp. albedinis]